MKTWVWPLVFCCGVGALVHTVFGGEFGGAIVYLAITLGYIFAITKDQP